MSITRCLTPNFNGVKFGNVKTWSPNASGNPRVGGALFKFGSYNRFDIEASRMFHVACELFGIKVNHIPFGTIVAGVIGGL